MALSGSWGGTGTWGGTGAAPLRPVGRARAGSVQALPVTPDQMGYTRTLLRTLVVYHGLAPTMSPMEKMEAIKRHADEDPVRFKQLLEVMADRKINREGRSVISSEDVDVIRSFLCDWSAMDLVKADRRTLYFTLQHNKSSEQRTPSELGAERQQLLQSLLLAPAQSPGKQTQESQQPSQHSQQERMPPLLAHAQLQPNTPHSNLHTRLDAKARAARARLEDAARPSAEAVQAAVESLRREAELLSRADAAVLALAHEGAVRSICAQLLGALDLHRERQQDEQQEGECAQQDEQCASPQPPLPPVMEHPEQGMQSASAASVLSSGHVHDGGHAQAPNMAHDRSTSTSSSSSSSSSKHSIRSIQRQSTAQTDPSSRSRSSSASYGAVSASAPAHNVMGDAQLAPHLQSSHGAHTIGSDRASAHKRRRADDEADAEVGELLAGDDAALWPSYRYKGTCTSFKGEPGLARGVSHGDAAEVPGGEKPAPGRARRMQRSRSEVGFGLDNVFEVSSKAHANTLLRQQQQQQQQQRWEQHQQAWASPRSAGTEATGAADTRYTSWDSQAEGAPAWADGALLAATDGDLDVPFAIDNDELDGLFEEGPDTWHFKDPRSPGAHSTQST